ncbi:MAG: hypothetical protein EBY28_09920 [Betaproteobacteria bacterium]|nr:hypothetical protein [Betaproteobacteria bacterium]
MLPALPKRIAVSWLAADALPEQLTEQLIEQLTEQLSEQFPDSVSVGLCGGGPPSPDDLTRSGRPASRHLAVHCIATRINFHTNGRAARALF